MHIFNAIRPLKKDEKIPYTLLLLADPSKELIDQYLAVSTLYIAEEAGIVFGVYVLTPVDSNIAEIKNIAVCETHQGKGIGTLLLRHAEDTARKNGYKKLIIGTGNSSIRQLYLYQKMGFEICGIKKDFFIINYKEALWENHIQCKHMILLSKTL